MLCLYLNSASQYRVCCLECRTCWSGLFSLSLFRCNGWTGCTGCLSIPSPPTWSSQTWLCLPWIPCAARAFWRCCWRTTEPWVLMAWKLVFCEKEGSNKQKSETFSFWQVLCVGPTGTGKTLTIANKLSRSMPKDYIPEFITFSAKTSANQTQDLIDGKLDKR